MNRYLFTSESVTSGHPDKICDQISDAVLDAVLQDDPEGRVACETFAPSDDTLYIGGEITTHTTVDIEGVVRALIRKIGYTDPAYGLSDQVKIVNLIKEQSPDIAQGVNEGEGLHAEQGAGDQGHMFGFAIHETADFMPLSLSLAHGLARRLEEVRQNGTLPYLRPDGKTQVTIHFDEAGKPLSDCIQGIVISTQHHPEVTHEVIVEDLKKHVIMPICGERLATDTVFHINPTGKFVIGGPAGDAGLTGRKIIVDTYGGGSLLYRAGHGGGAFSGKDPSKVDRSAAYAARYIAKNIVASGLAYACEVQFAYVIGVAAPVSLMVRTFGTGKVSDLVLADKVKEIFPLKPKDIIEYFGLKRPIYLPTATYGHFGGDAFPWEQVDKVDALLRACQG